MRQMFFIAISLTISFFPAKSQSVNGVDQLHRIGRQILEHPEYEVRDSVNEQFLSILSSYIQTEKGFNDPLKNVTNVLRLKLRDEARIYTWLMPDSSFQYRKFGLVAARNGETIRVTLLKESRLTDAQFKRLKPENWYGAIYYKALPVQKGRDQMYTLLGWSTGKDVHEKIVDVIKIDRKGNPQFGARIFRIEEFMDQTLRRPPMRLIMPYNAQYSVTVNWNKEKEMIIMDHLAPPDSKLKGVYRMYGPDFSYDGLKWKDGWWHLIKQVEFNTGQDVPIMPPSKPTDLPPNSKSHRTGNTNSDRR